MILFSLGLPSSFAVGRQLLTDYRYLQQWLTSSDQILGKSTLQWLSRAPIAMELERGLLTLCGTADLDEYDGNAPTTEEMEVTLPSHNFPVLFEVAWNSAKDWN